MFLYIFYRVPFFPSGCYKPRGKPSIPCLGYIKVTYKNCMLKVTYVYKQTHTHTYVWLYLFIEICGPFAGISHQPSVRPQRFASVRLIGALFDVHDYLWRVCPLYRLLFGLGKASAAHWTKRCMCRNHLLYAQVHSCVCIYMCSVHVMWLGNCIAAHLRMRTALLLAHTGKWSLQRFGRTSRLWFIRARTYIFTSSDISL